MAIASLITFSASAKILSADVNSNFTALNNGALANNAAGTITSTAVNQLTLAYDGTHTATFTVDVNGKLTVNSTTTVTVTPALTVTGALTCSAAATVGTTLGVTGAVTLSSTLAVSGGTTVVGLTQTDGDFVQNTTSATTRTLTLKVAGVIKSVIGVVTTAGDIASGTGVGDLVLRTQGTAFRVSTDGGGASALMVTAAGAATFAGALAITGALTGVTTGAFSGAVSMGGALTGVTTLATSSTINSQTISAAASFTGSVAIATTLAVTGASTLAAVTCTTLGMAGALTGATTGAFSGAVTLSSTLAVSGGTTVVGLTQTDGDFVQNTTSATTRTLTLEVAGVIKSIIGVVTTAGDITSGTGVGDLVLRTQSTAFRVSTNGGSTSALVLAATTGAATFASSLAMAGALTGVTTGTFSGAVSMTALTATTGAFSSTISGTVITASTALAAGGTVATIGDVRIKNNGAGLVARDAANAANLTVLDVDATNVCTISRSAALTLGNAALAIGFFGAAGATKAAVTGSRGGNAALASLLTYLASLGLLTDSSS